MFWGNWGKEKNNIYIYIKILKIYIEKNDVYTVYGLCMYIYECMKCDDDEYKFFQKNIKK